MNDFILHLVIVLDSFMAGVLVGAWLMYKADRRRRDTRE